MNCSDFLDFVHEQTRATVVLSSDETDDAIKLAHVLKQYTRDQVSHAISRAPGQPALLMHISDGWSGECQSHIKRVVPGTHLVITRKGKFRHEFLLQRLLFRQLDARSGDDTLLTVVGDPQGLHRGKKAWNVFVGACSFFSTLRAQGHRGLCANIYLADGHLFSALVRKFRAHHKLFYTVFADELGDEAWKLQNMDFTFGIKCASHSCNNGTRWGLSSVSSKEILENAHISTAALFSRSTALHGHIGIFLQHHLVFSAERSASDSELMQFWHAVGVDPTIVDLLVITDMHWDGNLIQIFRDRPKRVGLSVVVGACSSSLAFV